MAITTSSTQQISLNSLLKRTVLLCLMVIIFTSAYSQKTPALNKSQKQKLQQLIEESPVFRQLFTGFALYDPATKQYIYQKDADKYFTPASNTKLFTLYAALEILGDSMPVMQYDRQGEEFYFWGTGNPMFLNPDFPKDSLLFDFLKNQTGTLYYCADNFQDAQFGPGWAWDDYIYNFQAEKSDFPIYGNQLRLYPDSLLFQLTVAPIFFKPYIALNELLPNTYPSVSRSIGGNYFGYSFNAASNPRFSRTVPFHVSPPLTAALLSDTLGQVVLPGCPTTSGFRQTIYRPLADTLLIQLLHNSDNFVAEQLLLLCAAKLGVPMNSSDVIERFSKLYLLNSPDPLVWKDGSGLSRYNLFTPRSLIFILEKLYQKVPRERLLELFPAGGEEGTIAGWYGGKTPFVFAKSGSLSNNYCLSGYLVGKSGKVYLFSFMHNNFVLRSKLVKEEMEEVLLYLRDVL